MCGIYNILAMMSAFSSQLASFHVLWDMETWNPPCILVIWLLGNTCAFYVRWHKWHIRTSIMDMLQIYYCKYVFWIGITAHLDFQYDSHCVKLTDGIVTLFMLWWIRKALQVSPKEFLWQYFHFHFSSSSRFPPIWAQNGQSIYQIWTSKIW